MKLYIIEMPNGDKYKIPLCIIAENYFVYYGKESYKEVLEWFESDHYAAEDWAKNNMNWSDVEGVAVLYEKADLDYQEGWMNGKVEIIES